MSSDEEDDYNQLQTIESKLLQYDPAFTTQHTHASLSSQRSALLSAFRPQYEEGDIAGHSRIHLNTERWRVCETYFSPGMAGVDSAGVGEVLQSVLARFSEAEKGRLVKVGRVSHALCRRRLYGANDFFLIRIRMYSSRAAHRSCQVSATGCMRRSGRYYNPRCQLTDLYVPRILCWTRGGVWLRLRLRTASTRWVSRGKSMMSGVENASNGGGEGTGIPACGRHARVVCQ